MSRPVLVTGASSFVGAHVVDHLGAARPDWPVVALSFRTPLGLAPSPTRTSVSLDLCDPRSVERLARFEPRTIVHLACRANGRDAATHNAAMLDTVLAACRAAGADLVHGSTTQVGWARRNAYAASRAAEEARIAAAGVPHVVLRPCAPYGPPHAAHRPRHTESFQRLAEAVRRSPVVPVIGSGEQRRQPVHTRDFAEVVEAFLDRGPGLLPNRAFDVGGPSALSIRRIIDLIALALGRRVRVVSVPVAAATLASRWVDGFDPDLISTFDCDDLADPGPVAAATGKRDWVRFEAGVRDLVGPAWTGWTDRIGRRVTP